MRLSRSKWENFIRCPFCFYLKEKHNIDPPSTPRFNINMRVDALLKEKYKVQALFGPQHGARGEKQDNMIESAPYAAPFTGLTVHSLYSEVRKPTPEMLEGLDALVFDLQDVGVRVYTFIWTMLLAMEACAEAGIRLIEVDGSWDRKKKSIEELVR